MMSTVRVTGLLVLALGLTSAVPTGGEAQESSEELSKAAANPLADLVTYPSTIEGFGNAFLEALYFKRPIVVNNYTIYATDIRPKGFTVIEFDDYITDETVEMTRRVLADKKLEIEMCEHNYALANRHFSYAILRNKLKILLDNAFGTNNY